MQAPGADLRRGGEMRRKPPVSLRPPLVEDGATISDLISRCPPLDTNSVYSTLLLCTHFSQTCVVAERSGRAVGWISAYLPPETPDTLFVWQVAVDRLARGERLGGAMLEHLLSRPACERVSALQTTITMGNESSWRMFRGFAERRDAAFSAQPHFFRGSHFAGAHATEHLVTIGPFRTS